MESERLLNLENLANGAFAERTRQSIQRVMENIADPNTEWKNKRKVTVELTFSAAEDREIIECDVVAKEKLAPKKSVHTKFLLDKNLQGEVIASEFGKQVPGQQVMKVDPETGEIMKSEKEEDEEVAGLKIVK